MDSTEKNVDTPMPFSKLLCRYESPIWAQIYPTLIDSSKYVNQKVIHYSYSKIIIYKERICGT